MNIEQGMWKEDGGNRHEKAQENTKRIGWLILISRIRELVALFVVFRAFLWLSLSTVRALLPSTFLVRHSSVPAGASGVIWLTASPR
jgi:hypothetical protein